MLPFPSPTTGLPSEPSLLPHQRVLAVVCHHRRHSWSGCVLSSGDTLCSAGQVCVCELLMCALYHPTSPKCTYAHSECRTCSHKHIITPSHTDTHTHACAHTDTHTQVCTYRHTHTSVHIQTHAQVCTYRHTHTSVHIQTHPATFCVVG